MGPRQIVLKTPRIDGAGKLGPSKRITGEVDYELRGKLPGKVALRLTYRVGGTCTQSFYHLAKAPTAKKGTLRFSFAPLQDEKSKLGLSQFEVRKYDGVLRHLRITQVSHLFLARQTQRLGSRLNFRAQRAIAQPGKPLFEVRAPGFRQQQLLK